jgi:hypothetical protein
MADIDDVLNTATNIKGAFAVAVVDYDSGMTLGSRGGSAEFDLDVAASGNTEVARAEFEVMARLGLRERIEDILISLDTQYHVIRPVYSANDDSVFLYLVLNRQQANLAMARRDLRMIAERFRMSSPANEPSLVDQQDYQQRTDRQ